MALADATIVTIMAIIIIILFITLSFNVLLIANIAYSRLHAGGILLNGALEFPKRAGEFPKTNAGTHLIRIKCVNSQHQYVSYSLMEQEKINNYRAAVLAAMLATLGKNGEPKVSEKEARDILDTFTDDDLAFGMPYVSAEEMAETLLEG
uniref:Uncharacterized protein n=1 Tax=Prevotella sp. GTC17259 TaxID=3236795 RepID=A0AB33J2L5_9BACT